MIFDRFFKHQAPKGQTKPLHTKKPIKSSIRAYYDLTQPLNPAGGRKRRPSIVERVPEEGILKPEDRLRIIDLARDMARNDPQFASMLNTLRVNIVGDAGKLKFQSEDPWYRETANWFNNIWARHANFRDNSTWRESLQLVISTVNNEGDFVVVFDNGMFTGSGKLVFFEADQIANTDDATFQSYADQGYRQDSGIIFDKFGRECGVIVTNQRGLTIIPGSQALILIKDPDSFEDPDFLVVRRKFRLIQSRGVGSSVPALQSTIDSKEILDYELLSAKVNASRYASVIDAPEEGGVEIPGGFGDETDEEISEEVEEESHAYGLEHYCGGNVDYLPAGSDIRFDPTNRPNSNLPAFLDHMGRYAGGALGLIGGFATNQANSAYYGFRGEQLMSWQHFISAQQWLEDNFSDWVCRKVISWAVSKGFVEEPPEYWDTMIAWSYPRMPQVDPLKDAQATAQKFKNGTTTFRDELGPDYKDKLKQLADELAYCREINLPLSVFETVAGAQVNFNEEE